ncbi:MAG: hypothetical protein HOL37_05090 [Rhodospirillaceae bacterium]|jgi:hypothetical protein|nr:hypothetical protein [Rhodospirillaceae bacterium]MBT4219395.1 hypothetical protein [Rhodospirillaceae bacterium]MBT4463246.1 hypothetical protein [Rhodospirillaceae bacterium]MBT5014240.1 hypothetical protein [Rhodospirillaceae bacterium]MBT5308692.1 hypothetical protein [Rhodospirillaceae bacterium]
MATVYRLDNYKTTPMSVCASVHLGLAENRAHLSVIGRWINQYGKVLELFESRLQDHRNSCRRAEISNDRCHKILKRANADELIWLRDKIARKRRRRRRHH